jgi:hypothetical protein
VKRADLLHAVMSKTRQVIEREALTCEARGAEVAAPGEYILTAYGTPAEVVRLAEALRRDDELTGAELVEEVGDTNQRLRAAVDAERRRHLHIALMAPSLW